jgi:hypothetical protein
LTADAAAVDWDATARQRQRLRQPVTA